MAKRRRRGGDQRRRNERQLQDLRRAIPPLYSLSGAAAATLRRPRRPTNSLTEALRILLVVWPRTLHRCCACLYTGAALVTGLFSMLLVLAGVVIAIVSVLWMGLWGIMSNGWRSAAVCLLLGIVAGPWMAPAIARKFDDSHDYEGRRQTNNRMVRILYESTSSWFNSSSSDATRLMITSAVVIWGLYIVMWVLGHYIVLALASGCKRWLLYLLLMGPPPAVGGGEAMDGVP